MIVTCYACHPCSWAEQHITGAGSVVHQSLCIKINKKTLLMLMHESDEGFGHLIATAIHTYG